MRIYVLITKARPLKVWLYREGIVRFSSEKYDLKSLKNIYSHLTNTSINKYSANQNIMSGGTFGSGIKWTFEQMRACYRVSPRPLLLNIIHDLMLSHGRYLLNG